MLKNNEERNHIDPPRYAEPVPTSQIGRNEGLSTLAAFQTTRAPPPHSHASMLDLHDNQLVVKPVGVSGIWDHPRLDIWHTAETPRFKSDEAVFSPDVV